jgi:hypothetical protein
MLQTTHHEPINTWGIRQYQESAVLAPESNPQNFADLQPSPRMIQTDIRGGLQTHIDIFRKRDSLEKSISFNWERYKQAFLVANRMQSVVLQKTRNYVFLVTPGAPATSQIPRNIPRFRAGNIGDTMMPS